MTALKKFQISRQNSSWYLVRHEDGLSVQVVKDASLVQIRAVHHGNVVHGTSSVAREERFTERLQRVERVQPGRFEVNRVGQ